MEDYAFAAPSACGVCLGGAPQTRRAWVYRREGMHKAAEEVLRTANPDIEIPLAEIFPQ
jgi:hypothetical protein